MPTNLNEIVIVILFIIPGFVFSRIMGFAFPSRARNATQIMLDSLAASCVSYAFLSPLVWWLLQLEHKPGVYGWLLAGWFLVLFLFPVVSALILIRVSDSAAGRWTRELLHFKHPDPKAWDFFFRQGRSSWVVATLKDGTLLAGLFSTDSFASAFPNEEDLYLERVCTLSDDGKITGLSDGTEGAIIRAENIKLLEFYRVED